jgi:hypothetical protein
VDLIEALRSEKGMTLDEASQLVAGIPQLFTR